MKKIRNTHANATKYAVSNGFGQITQTEMSIVSFNFLGLQLNRPHLLGISDDNKEDREAYVHFWAVVIHMLGIEDEFNICLYPLEVVENICEIIMRYLFVPFLQLETKTFEKMLNALMNGVGYYLPYSSYSSTLFLVRRLVGIPGYHYVEDSPKKVFPKHYFSQEEYDFVKITLKGNAEFSYLSGLIITPQIYLFDFQTTKQNKGETLELFKNQFNIDPLLKMLDIENSNELFVTELNEANFKDFLTLDNILKLNVKEQDLIIKSIKLTNWMSYRISKFFFKIFAEFFIAYMTKNYYKKVKNVQ